MKEQRREKRQFWVLLALVFFGFMGISMPYLIFPALFLNPSFSIVPLEWSEGSKGLFLGITLAAYPLGQFVGSPILGALSDDYGRKWLLTGSLLVTAFCNVLTGFAIEGHYLTLLIASRFLAGLMEGNIAITRAMGTDLKTIPKQETFGKINASSAIAFLVGPLLGGIMADQTLWEGLTAATPFYLVALLFFVLTCLSALMLQKSIVLSSQAKTFWERIHLVQRLRVLFANRQLRILLIASTCFTLAVDIFYEFGPVYLTVKWMLSPSQLTLYNGVLCLALAFGNGWLPALMGSRFPNRWLVLFSMGGFSLLLIGIVFANSSLAMLLFFSLCGLAIGLAVTLIMVRISDSAADAIQGEVMGTQLSLRVLGDGAICLFGGGLLAVSPKLVLILAAGISTAAMIYYWRKS